MILTLWFIQALIASAQRYRDDDSYSRESESSSFDRASTPGITFRQFMNILDHRLRKFEESINDKTDKKIADLREEFSRQLDEIKSNGMVHDATNTGDYEDRLEETNQWLQKLDSDFESFQTKTDESIGELGQLAESLVTRTSQLENNSDNSDIKNTNSMDGSLLSSVNDNKQKISELEDQIVTMRVIQINDERALENLNRTVESLRQHSMTPSSSGTSPEITLRIEKLEEDVHKIRTSENDDLDELYETVLENKNEQNARITKLEKDLLQKSVDFKNYHEHEKTADLALAKKIQAIEKELENEKKDLENFISEVGHGDFGFITKKIVDLGNDLEQLFAKFENFKNEEFAQEERLDSVLRRAELMKESILNLQKTDEDFLFRLVDVETKIQNGYSPGSGGPSSTSIEQISYQLNKFKSFLREMKSQTNEMQDQIKSLEDKTSLEYSSLLRNQTRYETALSKIQENSEKKCIELEASLSKLEKQQKEAEMACESKVGALQDKVAADLLSIEEKTVSNKDYCEDKIKALSSTIIDTQEDIENKLASVENYIARKIAQSSQNSEIPPSIKNDLEKVKKQNEYESRQIEELKKSFQSCAREDDLLPLQRSVKALEVSTTAISEKLVEDTNSMDTLINKLSVEFHELELNFDKLMDSMNSQSSDTGVSSTVVAALEVKIDKVKTNFFDAQKDFQDFKNQLYLLDTKLDNQNENIKNMSRHTHSLPQELVALENKIKELQDELDRVKKEGISINNVQTTAAPTSNTRYPTADNWGSWQSCSVTCGRGTKRRYNNNLSSSNRVQNVPCEEKPCVSWSSWSSCSKTCGTGERRRENLTSMDMFNSESQKEACNTQPCPAEIPWSQWSVCTKTCGGGRRTRHSGSEVENDRCNTVNCPGWTEWSECSATCDGGTKSRNYIQYNSFNQPRSVDEEERVCNRVTCPWTEWSDCSVTCGEGFKSRRRGDREYKRRCIMSACTETTPFFYTTPPPNGDGMMGEIVIIGGRRGRSDKIGPKTVKSIKLSDGSEEIWSTDFELGWHRSCSVSFGGKIYVIGGSFTGQSIYEVSHSNTRKLTTELTSKFYYHSCAIMNNRVWIVAGSGGQGKNAVSFDIGFHQERFEPILRDSHYGGALVALHDEYLLISGGNSPRANSMEALIDGRTSWSFSSSLPERISGHQMIADPESNKMFALGGYDGHKERNEIYMIDMSCVVAKQCRLNSPAWSKVGTLHSPRDSHVSVLYRNKIYSFGGFTRTSLPDEFFSLESMNSEIMSTSHSLNSHTAVLL